MVSGGDVNSETIYNYAEALSSAVLNIPVNNVVVGKFLCLCTAM